MYCRNCGKEVPSTTNFCPECGSSLKVEVADDSTSSEKEAAKKNATLLGCFMAIAIMIIFFLMATFIIRGFVTSFTGNKEKYDADYLREQAKENAIKYMQDKYGITIEPTGVDVNGENLDDVYYSSSTVDFNYEGKDYRIIQVSNDEPGYRDAKDNFQAEYANKRIKEEILDIAGYDNNVIEITKFDRDYFGFGEFCDESTSSCLHETDLKYTAVSYYNVDNHYFDKLEERLKETDYQEFIVVIYNTMDGLRAANSYPTYNLVKTFFEDNDVVLAVYAYRNGEDFIVYKR